jgi:hypothetical protein
MNDFFLSECLISQCVSIVFSEELIRTQERLRILEEREIEREHRRLEEEKWYRLFKLFQSC